MPSESNFDVYVKVTKNRKQNKTNLFVFYAEVRIGQRSKCSPEKGNLPLPLLRGGGIVCLANQPHLSEGAGGGHQVIE